MLFTLYFRRCIKSLIEIVYLCTGTNKIPSGKIRISSIVWRYKVDPEEIAKRKDFVLAPGYLDSVELLNNPHWTIYTIEKDLVVFVLLPEPITTYTIENHPFIFVPLFEKVSFRLKNLLQGPHSRIKKTENRRIREKSSLKRSLWQKVSRSEFLKFAENLPQIHSREPCFSRTPLDVAAHYSAKMLNRPGVSACYAEHPALTVLSIALGEELMSESDVRTLLHATVTCLRAHLPVETLCILKTQSFEARLVPLCKDIPNLKHIFMFRKKALLSVEKACRRANQPSY
ncbi:hypothetical protein OSTOST_25612 [Ostertagia ostertagi]